MGERQGKKRNVAEVHPASFVGNISGKLENILEGSVCNLPIIDLNEALEEPCNIRIGYWSSHSLKGTYLYVCPKTIDGRRFHLQSQELDFFWGMN